MYITIHAPGDFSCHFVTPSDRSEICLVIHETAVEERFFVWACGSNMNLQAFKLSAISWFTLAYLSTTGRVLQILEHGKILARRKGSMISICARDDRTEPITELSENANICSLNNLHDRLVGLVLEIRVVELVEFRAHLLKFFFSRANLRYHEWMILIGVRKILPWNRHRWHSKIGQPSRGWPTENLSKRGYKNFQTLTSHCWKIFSWVSLSPRRKSSAVKVSLLTRKMDKVV